MNRLATLSLTTLAITASAQPCNERCVGEKKAGGCASGMARCRAEARDASEEKLCAELFGQCLSRAGTSAAAVDACVARCEQGSCPAGQRVNPDTEGHCCWPGQAWGNGKCVGLPTACPEGYEVSKPLQSCALPECANGRVRMRDGLHCCWPEQAWSISRGVCLGNPACPQGSRPNEAQDGCVSTSETAAPVAPSGAPAAPAPAGKQASRGHAVLVTGIAMIGAGLLTAVASIFLLGDRDTRVFGYILVAAGVLSTVVGVPLLILGIVNRAGTTEATVGVAMRF